MAILGTTQLGLYNGALLLLGERALTSTSEAREPRYILDNIYDEGIQYCLEKGLWNFAMRDVSITADGTDPTFGYSNRFALPTDYLRTNRISFSPSFNPPLNDYYQLAGYIHANGTPLYMQYVSNGASYGLALTTWPETFVYYVQTHLAAEMAERMTSAASKVEMLRKLEARRLSDASIKDVMNEGVRFKPTGSWVNSRGGGISGRRWDGTTI